MKDVSTTDLTNVQRIAAAFMDNVINRGDEDAARAFGKAATLPEILGLNIRRIWAELNGSAQSDRSVKAYLNYCTAALPVLERTYGQDHLLRALPSDAQDLQVIFTCRSVGAGAFADLCEKARMRLNTAPEDQADTPEP